MVAAHLLHFKGTTLDEDLHAATAQHCLSFEAYVRLLGMAHRKGLQGVLNNHYRPQDLACNKQMDPNVTTYKGNISYMATVLNTKLADYGLNRVTVPHLHSSKDVTDWTPPINAIHQLCQIAEHEYQALELQRSNLCG